jgi:hypothetical protein
MSWLVLALAACNPPLPEDTQPADTDTDAGDTDTDVPDTDTDTDPQLETIFSLSDPQATPADATNGWNPDESLAVSVRMTNLTNVDQVSYPGVRLEADHDLVFVQDPKEFYWFGLSANASDVATFTVLSDTAIPVDTVVTFTASALFMDCTESTDPPCPNPNPITFQVTIQAP